jgi:diguanylate cyclase (GGDEF)-like protein
VRKSSGYAFGVLLVLTLVFTYLEYRAFGHDVPIPMYGYSLAALLALGNLLINLLATGTYYQAMRLIGNGVLAMGTVIGAVYLQKYSAYHVIEFVLLAVWLGSLRAVRMVFTLAANLLLAGAFVAVMFVTDISGFWMTLVAALLLAAILLAAFIAYLTERAQRQLFLLSEFNDSMINRQELWAFTLIDLDMALDGIRDFKEVIGLLKRYLEPVIDFDSYILTSLEGQGPKPVPDKIEGTLFETEDSTLWSEDLLGKLTQTRQATTSAEYEIVKGPLGIKRKRFTSFRLDVPVFKDSKLMGVISLRRASQPFDELDQVASVSIAAQAMLIFKRSIGSPAATVQTAQVQAPQEVVRAGLNDTVTTRTSATAADMKDLEMTDHSISVADQTVAPREVVKRTRKETPKRTITLLSRENADRVAIDRYRTAAVEGEPLSILIVEVDGLSKLREQDGDQVAYKVFAAIVKYIFSKVDKEKDVLGRYGQNGLSVLMPRVDMNAAEKFAEMIRQFVANARYKTAYGEKTATLSIGVAAITDDTGDYGSMVKRADMALFVAKKNGRNCVKVRL